MRATDLKPSRKTSFGAAVPIPEIDIEIPVYLRRYDAERATWRAGVVLRAAAR